MLLAVAILGCTKVSAPAPDAHTPVQTMAVDSLQLEKRGLDSLRQHLDSQPPAARHSGTYAAQYDEFRRREAELDSLLAGRHRTGDSR